METDAPVVIQMAPPYCAGPSRRVSKRGEPSAHGDPWRHGSARPFPRLAPRSYTYAARSCRATVWGSNGVASAAREGRGSFVRAGGGGPSAAHPLGFVPLEVRGHDRGRRPTEHHDGAPVLRRPAPAASASVGSPARACSPRRHRSARPLPRLVPRSYTILCGARLPCDRVGTRWRALRGRGRPRGVCAGAGPVLHTSASFRSKCEDVIEAVAMVPILMAPPYCAGPPAPRQQARGPARAAARGTPLGKDALRPCTRRSCCPGSRRTRRPRPG
jgi:hypothetical protein